MESAQPWVVRMHDAAHPIAIYDPRGITMHDDPLPLSPGCHSKFDCDRTCILGERDQALETDILRAS